MRRLALIAAAFIAVGSPSHAAQDAESDLDTPPNLEVIDLVREVHNRPIVSVMIGEQGPFRFVVDTGAQATVLSQTLADRLELQDRSRATLVGISSRMDVHVAPLLGLQLGNRIFDIERVPLVPAENLGGADGILGLDSLQDQRVLMDFRRNSFEIADAQSLGGNRGYDIVVRAKRKLGQLVITSADIDGVRVAVIVGTGAQGSVGNIALQQRLRGRDAGEARMTDINGVEETSNMRLARSVSIGRARITNVPVAFADSPSFEALGLSDQPAMVLGMNELRLFRRVAIDFKERRILFDLPSSAGWYTQAGLLLTQ